MAEHLDQLQRNNLQLLPLLKESPAATSMSWSPIIEQGMVHKQLRYSIEKLTVAAGPVFLAIFRRDFVQKYPFAVWKIVPVYRQQLFCPVLKLAGLCSWGFSGQIAPGTPGLFHAPVSHTPTRLENMLASNKVYACKQLGGVVLTKIQELSRGQRSLLGLLLPPDLPAELHRLLQAGINK